MKELEERLDRILGGADARPHVAIESPRGWEYRRDDEAPVRAASVIKLLLLVEIYRQVGRGEMDFETPLVAENPQRLTGGSGVLSRLRHVEEMSVYDLLVLMVIVSDNAATNILLDLVGFSALDALVKDLGLSETRFRRKMLDMEAASRGEENVTSAADMLAVLKAVQRGAAHDSAPASMTEVLRAQQLGFKLSGHLPPEDAEAVYAHKTGELSQLEHDVGILDTSCGPVYVAVMLSDVAHNHAGRHAIAEVGRELYETFVV